MALSASRQTAASRPAPLLRELCLALTLLTWPVPALAGELHIDFTGLPCPEREAIASAIRRAAARPMEDQPDLHLVARRAQTPAALQVTLRGPDHSAERVVPWTRADCAALAPALKLMVRAWLDRRWTGVPTAPAPHALEIGGGTGPTVAAARASKPGDATFSSRVIVAGSRIATPPPRPREPRPLRVGLEGGVFGQPGFPSAHPCARLELGWRVAARWGVGLRAGLDDDLVRRLETGRIVAGAWHLFALARWTAPLGPLSFDALAGSGLSAITAEGKDFLVNQAYRSARPSWLVGARIRLPLGSGLDASLGVEGIVRAVEQRFTVAGAGEVIHLTRFRAGATAGIAWSPW